MKLKYSKDTPEGYVKIKEDSKLSCLLNEENKAVAIVEYLEIDYMRNIKTDRLCYNSRLLINVVADNEDLELFILKVLTIYFIKNYIFTTPNKTYEQYYEKESSYFGEDKGYSKYDCKEIQGYIFRLDSSKISFNQNESLSKPYIYEFLKNKFQWMKVTSDFKLLLFHGGSSPLPINRINFSYHGSEYGNGFYCAFSPLLSLEHRKRGCHIFSVYKLDLLGVFRNCKVDMKGSSSPDIIFSLGSMWCSSRGGQVVIKNSSVLPYLEYVDSYDRIDFNTLYRAGRFVDEYGDWEGIFEF